MSSSTTRSTRPSTNWKKARSSTGRPHHHRDRRGELLRAHGQLDSRSRSNTLYASRRASAKRPWYRSALTYSIATGLIQFGLGIQANYGIDNMRFLKPGADRATPCS